MLNTALQELLDHYEQLDKYQPAAELTDDARRSLVFYRAEAEYLRISNIDQVKARKRVRDWIVNVSAVAEFDVRYGRAPHKQPRPPRDRTAQRENSLAEWVDYRRDTWDKLCTYQQERLLCLPSFELDPYENQWDAQVQRYKDLVEREGHAPVVTSPNEEERLSAGWAARVRAQMRRGLLPKHRADEVGRLTGWWWQR